MGHTTYELTFPRDFELDRAARIFTALGGLYKRPTKHGEPWGRPTIVFEVLGLADGLHHLISFPASLEHSVRGHLQSVVPSIGMNEIVNQDRPWSLGVELRRHAANTIEADPKLVAVLLSSMRELSPGEAVMLQFVITPTGAGLMGEVADPFWMVGRLAARSSNAIRSRQLIERTLIAYRSLHVFGFARIPQRRLSAAMNYRAPIARWSGSLSAVSLAVVCGFPIGDTEMPGLIRGAGRKLVAAPTIPTTGIVIGTSTYPGALRRIAIDPQSLMQHEWLLGGTGAGKSTLLHNQAAQIMEQGHGLILIEPKGDLARDVLGSVPHDRIQDVIWFDPTDTARPVGFNVLSGSDPERTASHITSLMQDLYSDSWGPRLASILRYSVLTAAQAGLTLYDVKQLLVNPDFRRRILRANHDQEVRLFWQRLDTGPDNQLDSVINKLDAFVGFSAIRNIVGQTDGLDMVDVVTNNRILLVSLPTASLGAANAAMLGSLLVAQLWQHIRLRPERRPTYLMMDEFQNFLRLSVAMEDAFAEARSYNLGLIVANQHTGQLSPAVLAALKANARTKIAFGLGSQDAVKMSADFAPLSAGDLQGLAQYEIAASLMTPTGLAPTATARTLSAPHATGVGWLAREASRALYGRPVAQVEAEFAERFKSVDTERERPTIGRRTRTS